MMNDRAQTQAMFFDRDMIALRSYWVKQVSGDFTGGELRSDYPRPSEYAAETGVIDVDITGDLHEKLLRLVGSGSFLLYVTLMAALKLGLYKYTNSETIIVGSPARRHADADAPDNVLPIVDHLTAPLSFRQLLLNGRQTLLDAYERQRYPFERLVQDVGLDHVVNK